MRPSPAQLLTIALLAFAPSAHALCSYEGVDNAKTTIPQEFRDSKWVAKVRVLSETNNFANAATLEEDIWSLYELKVVDTFKGHPPDTIRYFTWRDSSGFYFDRPMAGPDIGGEYLVFLNPQQSYAGEPDIKKGTAFVNYNCGQSKPWAEVSTTERKTLQGLGKSRH